MMKGRFPMIGLTLTLITLGYFINRCMAGAACRI